jgi:MIP family channel proteins
MISFGLGSVAQFNFFKVESKNPDFLSINLGFGLGVTAAILVVGKSSGAHLNPAVSLAMFLTGRMSFLRLVVYTIGQVIGAFLGALLVFVVYLDALKAYKPGMYSLDSAGIFATYPNPNVGTFGCFVDQFVGTTFLIILVLAIADKKNNDIPAGTVAILFGLIVTVIGISFAYNCGIKT